MLMIHSKGVAKNMMSEHRQ